MEQLLDGLFRVLDPGAILAIAPLCLELLQEAETGRSGRVARSGVLGHAEALLAAMYHLITNAVRLISHPKAAAGSSFTPLAETTISRERIILIVKRREVKTDSLREYNAAVQRATQHGGAIVRRRRFESGERYRSPTPTEPAISHPKPSHEAVHEPHRVHVTDFEM